MDFQSIASFGQGLITTPIVILGGYLGNNEVQRIKQRAYWILVMFAVLLAGLVAIFRRIRGTLG